MHKVTHGPPDDICYHFGPQPEEQEKVRWLTKKVVDYVKKLEPQPDEEKLHKLAIVVEVLYELGFENIAQHFENKLNDESVEGKKFNSED